MLLSFVIITFLSACNSEEEVEEPELVEETFEELILVFAFFKITMFILQVN